MGGILNLSKISEDVELSETFRNINLLVIILAFKLYSSIMYIKYFFLMTAVIVT